MIRLAERDAGIAEVKLDADHAGQAQAALQLIEGSGPQRVGAAEADQPRRILRDLPGRPVIFLAGEPVRVRQRLTFVGEAVADRQDHGTLDAGLVQLTHEGGAVTLRHFDDRRERGADEMLVIVDQGRVERKRACGCTAGEQWKQCDECVFHKGTLQM